jgi:anaerobic ribonucleoside-triphosphate reductase
MVKLTKADLQSKYDYFQKYMMSSSNNATLSSDPNANFDQKSVAVLYREFNKDLQIQENTFFLGEKIRELFGEATEEEYYRQIKAGEIHSHDASQLFKPYCVAIDLSPFITGGNLLLGGSSKAPKHLHSYIGAYINLVFIISSQFAGAYADASFFVYFDYFARKDYGDDYLETHTVRIIDFLSQLIYSLNEPCGARDGQSVFSNFSVFDSYYMESLFGLSLMPDGTHADFKSIAMLQKFFMRWFNQERTKALLTFPVMTASFLLDEVTREAKDQEFFDFISQEYSEGNSFFIYSSDSVDALSSCCFDRFTPVLFRYIDGTVDVKCCGEIAAMDRADINAIDSVLYNGTWRKAKFISVPTPTEPLYSITLVNGKVLNATGDHLHPTSRGDIPSSNLLTGDYIKVNTVPIAIPADSDFGMSYDDGFMLGVYLNTDHAVLEEYLDELDYVPPDSCWMAVPDNVFVNIESKLETFVQDTRLNSVEPDYVIEHFMNHTIIRFDNEGFKVFFDYWVTNHQSSSSVQTLNLIALNQTMGFRQGILDGFSTVGYAETEATDSFIVQKNSLLFYTMDVLITGLGYVSFLNDDVHDGDRVVYRWYNFTDLIASGKQAYQDLSDLIVKDGELFIGIKSIKRIIDYTGDHVHCFRMESTDEPYFVLPNGVVTHNCRLRSSIKDNVFAYSLGGTGIATGSKKVFTLNMNRLIQLGRNITEEVKKVHKYLVAYNEILHQEYAAGLLSVYSAGFIHLDKQYLTVGINGLVEAAEYIGYEISDNSAYKGWVKSILGSIKVLNKEAGKMYYERFGHGVSFNTEFVPAEGVGVRFAHKDMADGFKVSRGCYNSYLYKVEDDTIDIFDKLNLYSGDVLSGLDGGAAVHLNLDACPDKDTWKKIINYAFKVGCNYFTYNVACTVCEEPECGYVDKRTLSYCSKCGSKNVSLATRVIGYLKKIKSFSEDRQIEAGYRFYTKV